MSLLHYIDNEVPALGEWDLKFEAGDSTIVPVAGDACGRGDAVLRTTIVGTDVAYVQKNLNVSLDPGGWIYFGFWMRPGSYPSNYTYPLMVKDALGSTTGLYSLLLTDLQIKVSTKDDGGAAHTAGYVTGLVLDRFSYLVFALRRSSGVAANDGVLRLYFDGQLLDEATGIDNYDRFASVDLLRMGCPAGPRDGYWYDFDEVKIALDEYPEPFTSTPLTDYPEAARTVVLFRRDDSESREFADYCVSELDIPRANLCPLPNATANESLADYATFEAEVETDLAAWLTLNPTVAANCSCFLLGYGVPGYFTSGGLKHSATSRLMNYGTAFSSQTTNPLYNPATVARLTKAAMGGKYLCTRIDADTLQHSKDVLDCGLRIADCGFLPATDKLFSNDSAYRASLACQHLRIITAGLGTFADDAFVWGNTMPDWGSAGSRAVFVDPSVASLGTMRAATTECSEAVLTALYAAAMGSAGNDGINVDAESFFEMLRIGGSLAEAFAVAVEHLDYLAAAVGSPLMTVAFSTTGNNVYRGLGGLEGIEWENPIAYLMPGPNSITLSQNLSPGQRYIYAVRSVSSSGVQERNTHVIAYANTDEQGILLPAPLTRPKDPTVEVQHSALLIGFTYLTPIGFADADGFDVLSDNGTGQLDLENPVATVEKSRNDRFDFEVPIDRPDTPVLLAVRARRGEQVGPISEIVFVPLVSAPASIQIL